jgi:hypothetical protein
MDKKEIWVDIPDYEGRTLSTLFRISTGMVSLIINNKNWSHI